MADKFMKIMKKCLIFPVLILLYACSAFNRPERNAGQIAAAALIEDSETEAEVFFRRTAPSGGYKEFYERYADTFRDEDFSPEKLSKYTDEELFYLDSAISKLKSVNSIFWLENLFHELEKRSAEKPEYLHKLDSWASWIHLRFMSKGMWDKAYSFKADYPDFDYHSMPERISYGSGMGKKGWRVLEMSADGKTAEVKYSGLDKGKDIVMLVSEGCHYSLDAIKAIETYAELKNAVSKYGTVIADNASYAWQKELGKKLGVKKVYMTYSEDEINSISAEGYPEILFLYNGKNVHRISGVDTRKPDLGFTKEFQEGLAALEKAEKEDKANADKIRKVISADVKKESQETSPIAELKSPVILNYSGLLKKSLDINVFDFVNNMAVHSGCLISARAAFCSFISTAECKTIHKQFDYCISDKEHFPKNLSMYLLLKGVSPKHKIEFARSIITKDGHIISAYLGGIEKDLGKAKAKEIASRLAGQEPQFDTVCEIAENAETGEKTIKAASKKGYFCLAE